MIVREKMTERRLPEQSILTPYARGWLEAAIDGEGYLGLGKIWEREWRPRISITNNNKEFLERIALIFGKLGKKRVYEDNRGSYHLNLSSGYIRKILPQLRLIVKREQQKLLLEALDLLRIKIHTKNTNRAFIDARLNEIHMEIKMLNSNKGEN